MKSPQLAANEKPVDVATLKLLSWLAEADARTCLAVLNGGHVRTAPRQRVLESLRVMGLDPRSET